MLGNYVILDKLGQGGMGMVLKAEHKRMKRVVAIKFLSPSVTKTPDAVRRFDREVEAAAKLDHVNIVAAYDADEVDRTHFLVMQYVDGRDLSALVKEEGRLSTQHALHCILQAARGLEYAHSRGVVHRDIKPANLLLDLEGTVKILDMGLARLESADAEQDQLTGSGQIMGTIDYMAPEQALDPRRADVRADIYALGMTLWFLLTGRGAYQGDSVMAKLLAHRESPIPLLSAACPEAPPELDEIFARMVAKQPQDRYQAMTEVIAALEPLLQGSPSAPSIAGAAGNESRSNFAPGPLAHTSAEPGRRMPARKIQEIPLAATGFEPTVALQLDQADTDPQTQVWLAPAATGGASESALPTSRKPRRRAAGVSRSRAILLSAVGGGTAFLLLAGIVFFVQTGAGTIRVEINDPQIEVAIKGTEIVFRQAHQGTDVKLSPGEKTLAVERGDFKFETDKLILKRGDEVIVHVELLAGEVQVRQGDKVIGQKMLPTPPIALAPFDYEVAERRQQAWADYGGLPAEKEIMLPGGEKLTLVLIPPGEFLMGSTEQEQAKFLKEVADSDNWAVARIPLEGPQHRVRIAQPFYLGKYEVTQAQWQSVMGDNPSEFKGDPTHPVEMVKWNDVQRFVVKLNENNSAKELTFALPTEAQWEYACRAGTTTPYYGGESVEELQVYGWFRDNSAGKTHPVGRLRPNAFGLFDMHGNVMEWCATAFAGNYAAKAPVDAPTQHSADPDRVYRGGSWFHKSWNCRSAHRSHNDPLHCHYNLGFRLACVLSEGG